MIVSNDRFAWLDLLTNSPAIAHLVTLIWFSALFITSATGEASYCAFEVKVSTQSGTPFPKVPVYLIKGHHSFSDQMTDASGIARLCDAPLTAVDIGVGFDVCGSVLVRDVKPTWPAVRQIYVTYVEMPCDHFTFGDSCQILLRIKDDEGRPVAGARFAGKPSAGSETVVSDVFGRLFRSVKRGAKLEGMVMKEGRKPVRISERCLDDVELKVVLHTP